MSDQLPSRRDFLTLAWGAAGALVLGEGIFVGLKFLAPRVAEGEFGGVFNIGNMPEFPPSSVTPFEAGRFYLVRLPDSGMLAVYRRCTHLGCAVPYVPARGQFVCPCHGSAFEMDGDVINQPAPRPLDLLTLTVEPDGTLLVDTGQTIERNQIDPAHIVYG